MKYVLLIILISASALAGSGDYVAPTANYDEGDWTKTDSIYSSDNMRATSTGINSHRVGGKGFGIAVTDGATIDSIIVKIEGYASSAIGLARSYQVQLSKDGGATGVGDAVTGTWGNGSGAEAVVTVRGSTNNLWGTTWTEAEIESANFTVNVKKNTLSTAAHFVDQITVAVWWTSASGFTGNRREKIISMGLTKPR